MAAALIWRHSARTWSMWTTPPVLRKTHTVRIRDTSRVTPAGHSMSSNGSLILRPARGPVHAQRPPRHQVKSSPTGTATSPTPARSGR
ncbi:hypothetical protein [Actinoplanes sp. NPDC026623]|uniref:hypothetical protein n=1 Tax=Actinoplanes sp. NPDC026623 TaxID=3155610 RepID=UPI00340A1E39